MRKIIRLILTAILFILSLAATTGCKAGDSSDSGQEAASKTEIQVFIAASLNTAMTEVVEKYEEEHPDIRVVLNADSSGTLMTQIEEGFACDIFFPADQEQMERLKEEGFMRSDSIADVLHNQVVLIALKDSPASVTGLKDLSKASNIALAGGSVPVGKYTRQALVRLGILKDTADLSEITSDEVSRALNNAEINEQANVSKALMSILEGACEVGTTYYSDIYGYEDDIRILETVSTELTGEITYPAGLVKNKDADSAQTAAAKEFYEYLLSDAAKSIFRSYYFRTDME